MRIMKRTIPFLMLLAMILMVSGCGTSSDTINMVSREDGSGTRSAFSEIFDITSKNDDGSIQDDTYIKSEITNSTAVVMLTVSEDVNALGYISMGSLNDSVKALEINGVAATPANVKNGSYPVERPFILAVKDRDNPLIEDFLKFIESREGQKIIDDLGYVGTVDNPDGFTAASKSGKITISGSSSVTPLIDALAEEYMAYNPSVTIEIQQSDSTTGMTSVEQGISDIGMSSRDLKDSELDQGLIPIQIAHDGLAVIVNPDNPLDSLTMDQVREIYTGQITTWSDLNS